MKACQLTTHGAPGKMEVRDLPDPKAGADEVVVRVRACGLNRLDLWAEEAGLPIAVELPRTLGCEISGEVESVGPGVNQWRAGDRVAIQSNLFCGTCEFCARGEESICLNSELLGIQKDGGFAEKVVVPARVLVNLPENVSFETAAGLTLAGSTAMHMLTHRTRVRQGDWVLVIGASSGVGSAAIQIAKQLGCYVITTGSTEDKRAFGKGLGADFVVDSMSRDWASEVRKITNKRGVDVVIEHVGGDVLQQCFTCLARNGKIVTCGATAGRDVAIKLWPLFVKQLSLIGSYGRNRTDIEATLRWASEGKLKAAVDKTFALGAVPEAFAALRARHVFGKLVVIP
jgi:NADPH:quinone reductase-like Zn-dependent oxidoreductase